MKNTLLIALFAAMPLMAQDCPQKPECAPVKPCCKMHCPHGPRPELTEEQKAEMKAKFEARKAKFMEKFDADKDGKISDTEKEAIKAEFAKRGPKGPRCGKKEHRRHRCGRPHGPRPELTEEQKAEMKAKFEARKAKFMEKFDADKDGKISDAEKEAIKAEFAKRGPKGPRCCKKGPRRPHGPRPELTEEQKAEMKAKFEARKAKFMEKFDTDKDGKISDAEKEAIKAECGKRCPKGPRPCCAPKCEQK